MRSTKCSLVLLLLGTALASPACGDGDDDGVNATAGSGGKSGSAGTAGAANGGEHAGESNGGVAGSAAGFAGDTNAPDAAGAPPIGEGGAADHAGGAGGAGGAAPASAVFHVYVGCAVPEGTLQSYRVSNGAFTALPSTTTDGSISNSAFNQAEDLLYVAHAVGSGPAARITTFARNVTTGALTPVGTPADVPFAMFGSGGMDAGGGGTAAGAGTGGAAAANPLPQTLTLDASESHLAVPNYGAGNVYVYDILQDGSVGEIVSADDGGLNAHHAVFSNNQDFMLVPYLGSNQIKVYAYEASTGAITLDSTVPMSASSSGPRHLALHPNGMWLYAINETAGGPGSASGSIELFSFDQSDGGLTPAQTYPVPLPDGYAGAKNGAEIAIAPSGNFLYVSMRLDSVAEGSLVVYSIAANGALTFVEQQSSRGLTPRQFSLSTDGAWLVVGNQSSATIELFSVDGSSGGLSFVAEQPVCESPRFARFAAIK
jgi:6-phosphogluconolactonase